MNKILQEIKVKPETAGEREALLPIDIVHHQAEDDGLWFAAQTASEAYLQQELHKLHSAVELLDALAYREAQPVAPERSADFADFLEGKGKFLGPKWHQVAKMAWDAALTTQASASGWIATHTSGKVLHLSKQDGWTVDSVVGDPLAAAPQAGQPPERAQCAFRDPHTGAAVLIDPPPEEAAPLEPREKT